MDQPREHLQGGGFAGSIGTEEAHDLAGLHRKAHVLHRHHVAMAAPQQVLHVAAQAGLPVGNAVGAAQLVNGNDRHAALRPLPLW